MGYIIPTNVPGARSPNGRGNQPPTIVGLLPKETWPTGEPAGMVSDNTIRRNYDGKVLRDLYAEGAKPLAIGGGLTSDDVLRQSNGAPLVAQWDGNLDPGVDDQGRPPGEVPAEAIFVAGKMPPEPVYDNPADGGWGAPIATTGGFGPPSSISRRDDRWFHLDGRITDAQSVIVGHWVGDRTKAIQDYYATGDSPLITWDGAQVIYSAPIGNDQTPTAAVVAPPPTYYGKPLNESGFEVDPKVYGDPAPVLTDPGGAGGGGSGVATPPPSVSPTVSPSVVPPAAGGDAAPATMPAAILQGTTFGIPNWGWLGALALIVLTSRGRR